MIDFMCQSLDMHGHTYCARCKLDWPTGVKNSPACKSKADPPIGFTTMYEVIADTARQVIDSQMALLAAKSRVTPYEPEMRRYAVLMAAAQLLARIYQDERIMGLLKAKP